MIRTAARNLEDLARGLGRVAALGLALLSGDPNTVAEEAARACGGTEEVMAASTSRVRPIRRLTPLGVVKGSFSSAAAGPPGRRTRPISLTFVLALEYNRTRE